MIARSVIEGSDYKAIKIFYSYSRNNAALRDSFDDVLSKYKWDVCVEPWYDGNIPAGDPWEQCLQSNLNSADIILLFISNAFLNSNYCYNIETSVALQRHDQGKARVIPIILEETDPDWRQLPIARLQVLPQNGQPVSKWMDNKEAFDSITQSIVNIIADQGINPRIRCKWKIVLDGDMAKFSPEERFKLVTQLRTLTGDNTLRPVKLKAGSIVLIMESTTSAFSTLASLYHSRSLNLFNGYSVMDISELYGADVMANCCYTEEGSSPDHEIPDPELLLFPSKRTHSSALNGVNVEPGENINFLFNIDLIGPECHGNPMKDEDKRTIQNRLFEYFFTGVAVKDENIWVNLGPEDRCRMLPEYLSGTSLGQVLLEADYNLKRLSSSLIHPDCETGKAFWKTVFARAHDKLGTTEMPYDIFTRVWIVPDEIIIYDNPNWCYTAYYSMKVMSEKDFLMEYSTSGASKDSPVSEICYDAFKEIILPVVKKEINEGETFAPLRELFSCMILAQWCKKRFTDGPGLKDMIDTNKHFVMEANGGGKFVDDDVRIPGNDEYYKKYMDVFKNGIFYEIRSDYDTYSNKKAVRTYFSGSIDFTRISSAMKVIADGGIKHTGKWFDRYARPE